MTLQPMPTHRIPKRGNTHAAAEAPRGRSVVRAGIAVIAANVATTLSATAAADSTDDFPIPSRILLSMDYAGRRAYSDNMYYNGADPLWLAWPNHMKVFFNNKGVAAKETDHCADYGPNDHSVWDWSPAR
jgi:hypothetical protein